MFSPINLIIAGLWFFSALIDYSDYCYLWQLKEYRWDRMRDFFSTKQGQLYWLKYSMFWRSLATLILFFWPINEVVTLKLILVVGFVADTLYNIYRVGRGRFRHPKITPKALLIIAGCLALEVVIAAYHWEWNNILFVVIIRFALIAAVVAVLNKFTRFIKELYIRAATRKLARYPHLIVVGITGSYGKSTVKEFASHILSQKFKVIKTPRNINTDIGVAQFILRNDFADKEIFVVEMGAYRIGEIKRICDIVHPRIGILTAINEQHLSLFGSIKNIQAAKYELLRALPVDGYAVTNADNAYCTEFLSKLASSRIETFGIEPANNPTCLTTEVKMDKTGITCIGTYLGHNGSITAPVIGIHQALNIAAAVMVAVYLGLSREQIQAGCRTLPRPENSLRIFNYGKATVIDDTYNSNPDGFRAALDILGSYASRRRRIVVTRGMLELGDKSDEIHARIGEEMAFVADELIVITPDFTHAFREGVGRLKDKFKLTITEKSDPVELRDYVRNLKDTDAVILFENRIPQLVHAELTEPAPYVLA